MTTRKTYKWVGAVVFLLSVSGLGLLYSHPEISPEFNWPQSDRFWEFDLSAEVPFQVEVAPPKVATRLGFYLKPTGGTLSNPLEAVVLVNGEPHVYVFSIHHPRKFIQEAFSFGQVIKVERLEIRVSEGVWEGWCEITY